MVEYSWEQSIFSFRLLSPTQPESISTWAHPKMQLKWLTIRSYNLTSWSHNTMASYKDFGDPFHHEPHTALKTLVQLEHLASEVDPWNLKNFLKAAHNLCLSSMHKPFWHDWALSDPSQFLTSEPLHHWHKQFWDHDAKWCINAVGASKLNFCFSIIQPFTSFYHFSGGISKLK